MMKSLSLLWKIFIMFCFNFFSCFLMTILNFIRYYLKLKMKTCRLLQHLVIIIAPPVMQWSLMTILLQVSKHIGHLMWWSLALYHYLLVFYFREYHNILCKELHLMVRNRFWYIMNWTYVRKSLCFYLISESQNFHSL